MACVGHWHSPAAALAWGHWCTGLSEPLHHTMWCLFKGPSTTGCRALQCTLYSLGAHKHSYYTHHNYKTPQNKNKKKSMNLWALKLYHTCKLDTFIFSQLQSAFLVLSQMWSMCLFLWSFSHFRVVHGILSLPLSSVQTRVGQLSLCPCILKFSNSQAHIQSKR